MGGFSKIQIAFLHVVILFYFFIKNVSKIVVDVISCSKIHKLTVNNLRVA